MKSVWLLVTMDDAQSLGEKPVVSVFASRELAKTAMHEEIQGECAVRCLSIEEIEHSEEGTFAQTSDGRFSWEILEEPIRGA
jgi:hypothetical protein